MSAIADVARVHDAWLDHERANAPAAVLELCSDDVRWLPPDGPAVSGKRDVEAWLRNNPFTISRLETSHREVSVTGRLATLVARFEVHGVDRAGAVVVSRGRHHWALERQPDGTWRVVRVSWVLEP